jgi:Fic family protein
LLRRATFARAIQGSNSIEGYNVTFEDAIAAAEGEEPLDAAQETWAAVMGYRNAMTYVLQLADDPGFAHSEGLLRSLHYMMLSYDLSKHPGRWRPGTIYVRREPSGEIVYEGPDAGLVPGLMGELVEALNAKDGVSVITRGAMAHLNLVMIHPFSDGNGRMARALQTLVLAREGILAPQFCSIEEYLGRNTPDYYAVLGEVGAGHWHPERDAKPWIRFCLTAHYRQAMTLLRRTRETERMWAELEREVTRRQLPDRVIFALADATVGLRVRSSTYRTAAEISAQVASRDLKMLVDQKLLLPHGEKRGRSYVASQWLRDLRQRTREPHTGIQDPFNKDEGPYLPGLEPAR